MAIVRPNTQIITSEREKSWVGDAAGLMYVLYISKVRIEHTAINSAEAQEVTAMKSTIKRATAPPFPSKAVAAKGEDKPLSKITESVYQISGKC